MIVEVRYVDAKQREVGVICVLGCTAQVVLESCQQEVTRPQANHFVHRQAHVHVWREHQVAMLPGL